MKDRALYLTINSLFEAGQYEDMVAFLVRAVDDDIAQNSLALEILSAVHTIPVVSPGTVYSRSPTQVAIKANEEVAKPLHICCRPAFEIGKPINEKRLDNLLGAIRTAIDRLMLSMIRATSATIESDNAITLFDKARDQFGTGVFGIYSGTDFGTEFSYATRSIPKHQFENHDDASNRILRHREILFQCFPRSNTYGSIYLGQVQNATVPGLDPTMFPAIKVEDPRSYGEHNFDKAISFSLVAEVLMTIEDPNTFIVGNVV
jgi:hypothetical protein